MKWVSAVLVAGLVVFAGCSKSDKNRSRASQAAMSLPKLQEAFTPGTPAQQANLQKAADGIRYSLYPQALAALEALASDPSLTDAQKKSANDMIEQVKQPMKAAAAKPAP